MGQWDICLWNQPFYFSLPVLVYMKGILYLCGFYNR